jgi:hypothetical protein
MDIVENAKVCIYILYKYEASSQEESHQESSQASVKQLRQALGALSYLEAIPPTPAIHFGSRLASFLFKNATSMESVCAQIPDAVVEGDDKTDRDKLCECLCAILDGALESDEKSPIADEMTRWMVTRGLCVQTLLASFALVRAKLSALKKL